MAEHFPNSYTESRRNFLAAASGAGATLHRYLQPGLLGRHGEDLTCDVAIIGPAAAPAAALVVCGTHGAEAYCGAAILHRWLTCQAAAAPADLRIVLVHAISPWAFSHQTRTTENNVDPNRNFIPHGDGRMRPNPAYDQLVPYLHATDYTAAGNLAAYRAYKAFLDQHGWHLENEMLAGQNHRPDGLFYAGTAPEWANTTFRRILREHLTGAAHIGFIDWHTCVGDYGDIVYLTFDDRDSAAYRAAARWWGLSHDEGTAFSSGAVPRYQGLLCHAIGQELPDAAVAGAVIEFGTVDAYTLFRADRLDRWLRFEGRLDPDHDRFREDYRAVNCPADVAWRRFVLDQGPAIIDRMIAGLAQA